MSAKGGPAVATRSTSSFALPRSPSFSPSSFRSREFRRRRRPGQFQRTIAPRRGVREGGGGGGEYINSKAFEALREVQKLQQQGRGKEEEEGGEEEEEAWEKAKTKKTRKPKNPFEAPRKPASTTSSSSSSSSSKTFSFVKKSVDVSSLPSLRDADVVLRRFDDEQRKRLSSSPSSSSSSSSPSSSSSSSSMVVRTSSTCAERSLCNAVRTLSYNAESIMFGICAETGREGIDALKVWTEELNLPRGKLHGLDTDGVPKPIPEEAVFIKYNSLSGDAFCSEYHGEFRGVLFTPVLNDGVFRQFGYLDLSLFGENE